MLSILDKYVLGSFVRDYLISLMALVGLYIALDMVFNFGNLTQSNSHALAGLSTWRIAYDIGDYYFYQSFFFFAQMAGIIAVAAASFTLMRLSRFNESTAILAAGVPLLRVAAPAILAGAVLNLVLLPADQELLIPHMIPMLARDRGDIHQAAVRTYPVDMMQDENEALFNAALYTPATAHSPAKLDYLDVIERDSQLRPTAHLYAASANWNPRLQQWDLIDGKRVPIASPDQTVPPVVETAAVYRSDITPAEIVLHQNEDSLQFLSLARINQLLARPRNYGTTNLLRNALHAPGPTAGEHHPDASGHSDGPDPPAADFKNRRRQSHAPLRPLHGLRLPGLRTGGNPAEPAMGRRLARHDGLAADLYLRADRGLFVGQD